MELLSGLQNHGGWRTLGIWFFKGAGLDPTHYTSRFHQLRQNDEAHPGALTSTSLFLTYPRPLTAHKSPAPSPH
jgi:hypothetical protein